MTPSILITLFGDGLLTFGYYLNGGRAWEIAVLGVALAVNLSLLLVTNHQRDHALDLAVTIMIRAEAAEEQRDELATQLFLRTRN